MSCKGHGFTMVTYFTSAGDTYCFSLSTPIFRENQSDSSFIHNFSLNGEHTQNVQRGECLAMHGALVAVGTRSGAVFVYHLNGKWKDQVSKPKNS